MRRLLWFCLSFRVLGVQVHISTRSLYGWALSQNLTPSAINRADRQGLRIAYLDIHAGPIWLWMSRGVRA